MAAPRRVAAPSGEPSYDGAVPDLLTARRRRPWRGWSVLFAAAGLAVVTGLGGCTSGGGDAGDGPVAPSSAVVARTAATEPSSEDVAAVTAVLEARAAAVVAGDEQAYAATVADPASTAGRRQHASYDAARALRVSRLDVGTPVVEAGPSETGGPLRTARAEVEVRYRVDDLDRADRSARLVYDLERSGSGWAVTSETPAGPGATLPWVAMPGLRVHRGEHGVVAGTVPTARLREHTAVVDRALPGLRRDWEATPDRVLVLAPATAQEADALLGRTSGPGTAEVAATTEGPTDAAGLATGDRVVLDPTAYGRLTPAGRDVVLTHELAHVAVQASVPGRAAGWLAEGYADHVGYDRADVPDERLLEPLLAEVRAGRGPTRLPEPAELDPAAGEIEEPYLAAWQAVELLADEHGEDGLRRLLVAGSSTGSPKDAETATDLALRDVLGTSRDALTRLWRQRLRELAR